MNIPTRSDLADLLQPHEGPCLSFFVPVDQRGWESGARIHLKNQINESLEKLLSGGMRRPDALAAVEPAQRLRNDEFFWRSVGDGVAVFCGRGFERVFSVPQAFAPQHFVGQRYYVKPLMSSLETAGRYYVLALTSDSATLYNATPQSFEEVPLPAIPNPEPVPGSQSLQLHSHRTVGSGKGKQADAMFHGQGGADDTRLDDIRHYFGRVDQAMRQSIADRDVPLILACVDYLVPIYETVNSQCNLLHVHLSGNPRTWTPTELHEQSLEVARAYFAQAKERAQAALEDARAAGLASDDVREILLAAHDGRIDTLFVDDQQPIWGQADFQLRSVTRSADANGSTDDLADLATRLCLQNGGKVFTCRRSTGEPCLSARFRY